MTDQHDSISTQNPRRRSKLLIAAAALLGVGGAIGAGAVATTRPSVTMAPATPVAIRSLGTDGIVTIRGQVAEIFGNKFVMADPSGRALVDTGREGEDGKLVAAGQTVTVQGRFDHGFVRAAFLVGSDGKVQALGPLGGPPRDHDGPRHGPGRPGGPEGRGGPDDMGRPDGPPAPPAATSVPATAPAASAPSAT